VSSQGAQKGTDQHRFTCQIPRSLPATSKHDMFHLDPNNYSSFFTTLFPQVRGKASSYGNAHGPHFSGFRSVSIKQFQFPALKLLPSPSASRPVHQSDVPPKLRSRGRLGAVVRLPFRCEHHSLRDSSMSTYALKVASGFWLLASGFWFSCSLSQRWHRHTHASTTARQNTGSPTCTQSHQPTARWRMTPRL